MLFRSYKLTDEDKALYNNHIPAGLDMSLFLGWRTKGYPNSEPSIVGQTVFAGLAEEGTNNAKTNFVVAWNTGHGGQGGGVSGGTTSGGNSSGNDHVNKP